MKLQRLAKGINLAVLGLAVLGLALLEGSMGGTAVNAQEQGGLSARLLVYSGRPDPEIDLGEDAAVLDLLRGLSAAAASDFDGTTVIPAILGYKGILISNPAGLGDLPATIAVYRGNVEFGGDQKRFVRDEGRALERSLLVRAVEAGLVDEGLLRAEKLLVEETPVEPSEEEETPRR